MNRRPVVAANWKMHKTADEARALARAVVRGVPPAPTAQVVLCPPVVSLAVVAEELRGSPVELGAQNLFWKKEGAYTGEVSAEMLADVGCAFAIVGHSERRTLFGETDDGVNRKLRAALDASLQPILCIGESLEQRENDLTHEVLARQLARGLADLADRVAGMVVAYEPVWAIGTGKTATPEQAQTTHAFVRETLADLAGADAAERVRILYGGSIKPENAAALFALNDVDGGLVGGASLVSGSFMEIVHAVQDVSAD